MRSAGYQDDSPRCWCCNNNRPFYSVLIIITSIVLLSMLASLSYGGYYIYTRRDAWIAADEQSQNSYTDDGVVTMSEIDSTYSEDTPVPDGPNDVQPPSATQSDEPEKRTRTKRPDISNEEIKAISSQLWAIDRQNQIPQNLYQINPQGKVNISERVDHAPLPLFSRMNADLSTWSMTFTRFIALLNNYNPQVKVSEEITEGEKQETESFLDALLQTRVMQALYQFLVEKRILTSDPQDFRKKLKDLWFDPYSRSTRYNATDSSGFEHVFVGETRGKVTGFHNWIQYYLQEKEGNANYYGHHYYAPDQPWMINIQFTWLNKFKKETSFFLGTNPEFDFAIYTLCIMTRTNKGCQLNINGLNPTILSYDINHTQGLQVGTSFPAI